MEFYEIPDYSPFIEKMKKGELTLEEILDNDGIIDDLKSREQSDFLEFFTNKQIKKLIDYSTRFPKSDDRLIGYKFPFNSAEILCSENYEFFNKLMSGKKLKENPTQKKRAKDFVKKINKGGFFDVFFKAIKKAEGTSEELLEEISNDTNDNSEDDEDENNNNENINININKTKDSNNLVFNYFRGSLNAAQESKDEENMIYENIDHLLGFLKESEETRHNNVLDGYFHRILSNLITMDQKGKLIKYLLNYPKKEEFDVLNLFVKNMKRKSKNMFNIIQKLLLFKEDQNQNIYSDTSNKNKLLKEQKTNLLKLILDELDITNEPEKYECICDSLSGLMSKTQFLENEYDSLNPLEYLYKILINSKKNHRKCNYILNLLIKINENILKLFDSRCTPVLEEENEENNDLLNIYNSYNFNNFNPIGNNRYSSVPEDNHSKTLENILLNLFEILETNKFEFLDDFGNCDLDDNNEFMSTYMEKQKKIGMKKIAQIEYIRTILDIFVNSCYSEYYTDKVENLIKIAGEKNIFWNLHKLFFLFPFSNIYQIYYMQIISIVININSPKCLIDYFFYEKNQKKYLMDLYVEKLVSNKNFEFKQTNTKVLSPIFAFIINLLNKINNTDNLYLSENYLNSNNNFKVFIEIFGKDIEDIFTEKLLQNDKNFQGFNFNENQEENLNYFCKKNFLELLEEDLDIYEKYKKGEDYKDVLEEKKKRIEKEKEERKKENEKHEDIKKENIKELDDDEDDDDSPFFKIEKIKTEDNDNNFLSLLNKPPEEIKKFMENKENNNDDEKEPQENDNEIDIKELENDEVNINDLKINEEIEPNEMKNKTYNVRYNRQINEPEKVEQEEIKDEKNNENNNENNENKDENNEINNENNENKDENNENINELGEVNDDIVDI